MECYMLQAKRYKLNVTSYMLHLPICVGNGFLAVDAFP